jgi:phosphoribosylamine--glycine ligase
MKLLVVGGGGREHAIVWKLKRDAPSDAVFCAPGNAGTDGPVANLPIAAEDLPGLLAWARANRPDLTVVGPEAPLCEGLVDAFEQAGLRAFGPSRAAARLEGSKIFAKDVMRSAGVPTARAAACGSAAEARRALAEFGLPIVIKADGLAAGKGVSVCATRPEAEAAIERMLVEGVFGRAGERVLVEEFLDGEEASVLALVDGRACALLPAAQDHKRLLDGDRGPNTGGMGAYSPAPAVTADVLDAVQRAVFAPVVAEMARRGTPYRGVLYAGLMLTPAGLRVLEFNCRFGDPETQAILPRLDVPLAPLLAACLDGTLRPGSVPARPDPCVSVVMAAAGYPAAVRKGDPIEGLERAAGRPGVMVFHAGTARTDGRVCTAGGRVLAVTATGANLPAALKRVYEACGDIRFEGAQYRRDIAHRALASGGKARQEGP